MNISTRYNRLSPKTSSRSQPKIRTRAEGRAERPRLGCADRLYPTTLSAGRGLTNTCPNRFNKRPFAAGSPVRESEPLHAPSEEMKTFGSINGRIV